MADYYTKVGETFPRRSDGVEELNVYERRNAMAEMWKPKDPEVLKSWANTILDEARDDLNEWEENFVEDMVAYLAKGRQLSERQEEKLEDIYAEKTK